MRLIDADKLRQKDMNGDLVDIFDVLEEPIIEAIPVEWLKKWSIQNQSMNYGNGRNAIIKLLNDWKEETLKVMFNELTSVFFVLLLAGLILTICTTVC